MAARRRRRRPRVDSSTFRRHTTDEESAARDDQAVVGPSLGPLTNSPRTRWLVVFGVCSPVRTCERVARSRVEDGRRPDWRKRPSHLSTDVSCNCMLVITNSPPLTTRRCLQTIAALVAVCLVSDIAVFVLKRDIRLKSTNQPCSMP